MKNPLSKKKLALVDKAALWTLKDLAVKMGLHIRTVKYWWKRLKVPPDACDGHGCHRWTPEAATRLIELWKLYHRQRGTTPEIVKAKAAGTFDSEANQQFFNFNATQTKNIKEKVTSQKTRSRAGSAFSGHTAGTLRAAVPCPSARSKRAH